MTTVGEKWWLELNTVDLSKRCWRVTDYSDLLAVTVRGSDLLVPLVDGATPYRRYLAPFTASLPVTLDGNFDSSDTAADDPVATVVANWFDLIDSLGIAGDASAEDGTVEAVFHGPEFLLTADVHVLGVVGTTDVGPGALATRIDISFPAGGWTAGGAS